MKKYIAIDIDNTLNNFSETLKTAEFTYHDQEVYDKYIDRVRKDNVHEESNNELRNLTDSIHKQCYRMAKARPDAVKFMQWLRRMGYTIIILTARDLRYCIKDTNAWLTMKMIPYDMIIHADNKTVFCNLWKIPILIDDEKVNIIACGGDEKTQLYYPICPHNEKFIEEWSKHDETFSIGKVKGFHNFTEVQQWIRK